jgi:hypothetical protein
MGMAKTAAVAVVGGVGVGVGTGSKAYGVLERTHILSSHLI